MTNCKECGKKFITMSKFCSNCGKKLSKWSTIMSMITEAFILVVFIALVGIVLEKPYTSNQNPSTTIPNLDIFQKYTTAMAYGCIAPCTKISNGTITNVFVTLRGDTVAWTQQMRDYYELIKAEGQLDNFVQICISSPVLCRNFDLEDTFPTIPLKLANGTVVKEPDLNKSVTPQFFSETISTLTKGRTDKEFVAEVFNFVQQITTYSSIFYNDTIRTEYPLQTLTTTVGDCKDFSVLVASMLEAGNKQAGYGMKIKFVFTKSVVNSSITELDVPNHVLVQVIFADGTSTYVESTSKGEMNPYSYVNGWYVDT